MNLQIINNTSGKAEYVLLPVHAYQKLKPQIEKILNELESDYVPFLVEDYVQNPVALARIKADLTQEELADRMGVTQSYISKLEGKEKVGPKSMEKVLKACKGKAARKKN